MFYRMNADVDNAEILERFEYALENYAKYSFVARIQYECVMKAVGLLKCSRRYIAMEVKDRGWINCGLKGYWMREIEL